MSIFIAIVAFLIILIVAIMVHEMGHFITAKVTKVKVEELGLGLPPRIWGVKRGETIYSINWIPLGGFCRMAGEEDPDVPESLAGRSVKVRLLVLSAGSLFMLLLPLFLLPISYMTPISRPVEEGLVQIHSFTEDSPAEAAGLEVGDIFLTIDGAEIHSYDDVATATEGKEGTEAVIMVSRNSTEIEKMVLLRTEEEISAGEKPLGIQMSYVSEIVSYPPWEAISRGLKDYGEVYVNIGTAFGSLFAGDVPLKDSVVGIVGIADITTEIADLGIEPLITWAVIILVILGIVNLLPLPALDGGRIIFVIIEGIRRGKRISPKKEALVHQVGLLALFALFIVITYNDIMRIIQGGSFLP